MTRQGKGKSKSEFTCACAINVREAFSRIIRIAFQRHDRHLLGHHHKRNELWMTSTFPDNVQDAIPNFVPGHVVLFFPCHQTILTGKTIKDTQSAPRPPYCCTDDEI